MQSSFLIKNHATANFDNYLQMMKKRKTISIVAKDGPEPSSPGSKATPLYEKQKTMAPP
jgi:hypothetical protein